jgi:signal transduction histidine kinase
MRRFASDLFTGRGVSFRFQGPADGEAVHLGADLRRHVLLVFKEGVNNIVKHSGCTEAEIDFRLEDHVLFLRLKDNGRGLAATAGADGHGLVSMNGRARALGGRFQVVSDSPGTILTLSVPLRGRSSPAEVPSSTDAA